jgi:phosphoribosylformimino-5-aminoimidazole carboxamide ribotide isomerase
MILFPAIDLKDGACVRLLQGEMEKATIFAENPAEQAKAFEAEGAEYLHIVDLNGAFAGEAVNKAAVMGILDAVNIPIQLGGGIRTLEHIRMWLDAGVDRVILGTVAVKDPELVMEACERYPGKIVVGVDAKGGKVAVEGWAEVSELTVFELVDKFVDAGVAAIVYTNIDKDGMMQGPDLQGTKELAQYSPIPVIASGGVSSMDDLRALKQIEHSGIVGVISGRAVYDKQIDLKEAFALMRH